MRGTTGRRRTRGMAPSPPRGMGMSRETSDRNRREGKTMKIVYRFTGTTEAESQQFAHAMQKKEAKLDRLTGRVKGDEAVLRINVRRSAKPAGVRVSATLTLRRGVLFVEREHADPLTALDRAAEALFEEIRSFRSSAFRERQRRRHKRIAQELEQAQ